MIGAATLNRALYSIGLERRRRPGALFLPALGVLGTGVLIGAGVGLLFAPRRGADLRKQVSRGVIDLIPARLRRSTGRQAIRSQASAAR